MKTARYRRNPNRVLFLDIDGPMIPIRAYTMPGQTRPIVTKFDPCAVGFVNRACFKQGRQIVLHTSWIRTGFWKPNIDGPGDVHDHCISQGIEAELFHEDAYCNREIHWRYDRIDEWLSRHPEVDDYVILDDVNCPDEWDKKAHLLLVDEGNGLLMSDFNKMQDGTWT
jgi:hypothetical protein